MGREYAVGPMAPPAIEEPAPGTLCGVCGEPLRVASDFCGACHERALEIHAQHEEAIRADWREARRRARNRMAHRAVRA